MSRLTGRPRAAARHIPFLLLAWLGVVPAWARAEADGAAAVAITGLAHAPLDEVRRIVRTWDVPTALRYDDVGPQAVRKDVTPRLVALVDAAARDQAITASDAAHLTAQLRQEPPREGSPAGPPGPPDNAAPAPPPLE